MGHSDILILGAGPAGSALAILLARAGLAVTLIDSAVHPRHHVGESLLPASMPILADLGLPPELLAARYQPKSGARFYAPASDQLATFAFDPVIPGTCPAYQVLREDFDALLADRARAAGCTLLENMAVEAFSEDADRPTVTLSDGRTLSARFLADATGRAAVIAAKRREKTIIPRYGRLAIYNYFQHLPPHDELDPAFITMYVFADHGGGWVWLIPLKDGRTSVGIVFRDPAAVLSRARPPSPMAGPDSNSAPACASRPETLFWQAAHSMPRLAARLGAARPTDSYRVLADYSFTVARKYGPAGGGKPTWLALGDAAGFLDPIFSSGVHLALCAADRAAPAILETLETGSPAALEAYAGRLDAGFRVFGAFVDRFYNRDLVHTLFFMKNKPAATHRAITQILAGHVWDPANPVLQMLGILAPAAQEAAS